MLNLNIYLIAIHFLNYRKLGKEKKNFHFFGEASGAAGSCLAHPVGLVIHFFKKITNSFIVLAYTPTL